MIPLWFLKEAKVIWEQVIQPVLSDEPPQEILLLRDWGAIHCAQNTLEHGWDITVEGPKLRRLSLCIEINHPETS